MLNSNFLVLAGGFGTRLGSTIGDLPKVLAPVNEKPFLWYQMNNWLAHGITDFTFLLHYKADLIINFLEEYKKSSASKLNLNFVIEDEPLGTGGAVLNAVRLNKYKKVTIINADTWLRLGFKDLLNSPNPTILVVGVQNTSRFGRVALSSDNLILGFSEKDGITSPGLINAGLISLSADILESINKTKFSLEDDVLKSLAQNKKLHAIISKSDFFDIGVPEDLNLFSKYIKKNELDFYAKN